MKWVIYYSWRYCNFHEIRINDREAQKSTFGLYSHSGSKCKSVSNLSLSSRTEGGPGWWDSAALHLFICGVGLLHSFICSINWLNAQLVSSSGQAGSLQCNGGRKQGGVRPIGTAGPSLNGHHSRQVRHWLEGRELWISERHRNNRDTSSKSYLWWYQKSKNGGCI